MPARGIRTERADFIRPETQVLEIPRKMRDECFAGGLWAVDLVAVSEAKARGAVYDARWPTGY
jgi:hypothetical protein